MVVLLGGSKTIALPQLIEDVPYGSAITSEDIAAIEVPASFEESYLGYDDIGESMTAQRSLRAGDLLRPTDVGSAASGVVVRVPLVVAPASSLHVGDTVSLWHIAEASVSLDSSARVISEDAIIVSVIQDEALVDSGVSVELRIDESDVESVLAVLGTQDSFAIVGQS